MLLERAAEAAAEEAHGAEIHRYPLTELLDYVRNVDAEELTFLHEAFRMNLALFEEGRASDRLTFLPGLLAENGGVVFSNDAQKTASLLCNGAIEARVLGLSRPAMSVTGSGAGCADHWPLCNGVLVPRAPSSDREITRTTSAVPASASAAA